MHFRMHESGLHYYDPAEYFTFVTTVTDNKKYHSKQYIKAVDRAAELYRAITYPSVVDYIWSIHSNQIKEYPVTVQDRYVVIAILGKDIFSLKVNTTRKKTIPVTEDLIQVLKELIKLHRDVLITADIFFVNTIPFFLTLRSKLFLPWYTILRTENLRQYTPPAVRCTYNIESGYLRL